MKGIGRVLLILIGLIVSMAGYSQGGDTLIYKIKKPIAWEDFKGQPDFFDRSKGAQIAVTINLKVKKVSFWSGRATYDAYAIAFKDQSWVKKEYKDAYTLAHEQLHFDIAHIYAETLELQINNLPKSERHKDKVNEMLRETTLAMRKYQEIYDRETSGGNNKVKQKVWANKVASDLKVFN